MSEIKLYKSSWKGIRLIALTLPFVIFGIFMISDEPNGTFNFYMGWLAVAFFGLGIPLGIFTLLDKRAQIIINEVGIFDRTLKQDIIKWEQIIETYPFENNYQKYISIVVDKTYKFKKKQYKWATKLNYLVGAQRLNLNLGLIKIDETKLSELINNIKNSDKYKRQNLIQSFTSSQKLLPNEDFQNYLIYFFALVVLIILSLNNFIAFMSIVVLMGISGLIAKWYSGTNNKSMLYKYARILAFLGLINIAAILTVFKIYDSTSKNIGINITNEIETYKNKVGKYPNELNNIREKLDLNLFQNYLANKINYKLSETEYKLELEFLNHKRKEFDKELKEWK